MAIRVPEAVATRTFDDEAAERIVIGSMMLSPEAGDVASEILTAADFYRPRHATIFSAITAALATEAPTDPVAIAYALAEAGELERTGGAAYLAELISAVPVACQVAHYARIVADWAARRRVLAAGVKLETLSGDLTRSVGEVLDAAQAEVHAATTTADRSAHVAWAELLTPALTALRAPQSAETTHPGVRTGLRGLDAILGRLKPGQLIIPAGRPSMGKSIFATDLARAVAFAQGGSAVIFTLEMSATELLDRVMAAECGVSLTKVQHRELTDADRTRIIDHMRPLAGASLFIDDTARLTLADIRSKCRRIKQRRGLDLVIIDYIQLMTLAGRVESRQQEVSEISRGLKLLAKELECPIVAVSQLNRGSEMRQDKRPQLSDLRESGALEQNADIVIMLHREDYYDKASTARGKIELIVAKNRGGATDTVTASAQLWYSRIVDPGRVESWSPSKVVTGGRT